MYNADKTCTPNMYSKHVHNLQQTCTANMYIIYTKHVHQTCTYLSKHVHGFCWKFMFLRFIEPFATFQRNSEIATVGLCRQFLHFPKFACPVFEEGFLLVVPSQNSHSVVKFIFVVTFLNSVVFQAKPSPAVGRRDTKKGS